MVRGNAIPSPPRVGRFPTPPRPPASPPAPPWEYGGQSDRPPWQTADSSLRPSEGAPRRPRSVCPEHAPFLREVPVRMGPSAARRGLMTRPKRPYLVLPGVCPECRPHERKQRGREPRYRVPSWKCAATTSPAGSITSRTESKSNRWQADRASNPDTRVSSPLLFPLSYRPAF